MFTTTLYLQHVSYDNQFALQQIEEGHYSILSRPPVTDADKLGPASKGRTLPRVITLGGDHTITLPLLRSINRAYGPVTVIHFDSHLDTCKLTCYISTIPTLIPYREAKGLRWLTLGSRKYQPRHILLPCRDGRSACQRY